MTSFPLACKTSRGMPSSTGSWFAVIKIDAPVTYATTTVRLMNCVRSATRKKAPAMSSAAVMNTSSGIMPIRSMFG